MLTLKKTNIHIQSLVVLYSKKFPRQLMSGGFLCWHYSKYDLQME